MISHEHRCIFVHIPKTAGNSINRVFGVGWQDHKDLQRYCDELPHDVFATYFKFAIVRNPWDRLFSDYNYQLKKSREKDSKLFLFTPTGTKRNFAEWVEVALAEPDYYDPSRWGGAVSTHIHRWSPQYDWISVDGRPGTDFVAHLERLSDDFPVICRRLGLPPVSLPHRNRRLHLHYSHYYDTTTRSVVAAYYARDIEWFGFEFQHAFLRMSFSWPKARLADAVSAPEPGADADGGPEHTSTRSYSFPGALRASARRAWLGRYGLALAASITLFARTFSATPMEDSFAGESHLSLPEVLVQRSVQQALATYAAPLPHEQTSLAAARRSSRNWNQVRISLEPSPGTTLGFIPMVVTEPPDSPSVAPRRRFYAVPPAADVRSGSSPAPRWWWNRRPDA